VGEEINAESADVKTVAAAMAATVFLANEFIDVFSFDEVPRA
jgi:hypothetical protein